MPELLFSVLYLPLPPSCTLLPNFSKTRSMAQGHMRVSIWDRERKVGFEYPLVGSEMWSLGGSHLDKSLPLTTLSLTSCPPNDQSSPVPPMN